MAFDSPFARPGRWFKGNLHTHTTQSDGALSPAEAVAWYRGQGYDFVAITDHWVLTRGADLDAGDGFVVVSGAELHGPGYHLLTVGLNELPERAVAEDPAACVRAAVERGALAYFAHPYWTGQSSAEILPVEGIAGIEVYNAVCDVTRGLGYSNVHWDDLLAAGRRLVGLAVDDVHWKHGAGGKGWVMVRAEEASEAEILRALAEGAFYASTGPTIEDLSVVDLDEGKLGLRVRCSPCSDIVFHARGPRGKRFSVASPTLKEAVLPITPDQVFLRVACFDGAGVAWSNPLYVADVLG